MIRKDGQDGAVFQSIRCATNNYPPTRSLPFFYYFSCSCSFFLLLFSFSFPSFSISSSFFCSCPRTRSPPLSLSLTLALAFALSHLYRNFLHFLLPLFHPWTANGGRRLRNDERFSIPGAKARGCLSSTEEPPVIIFGIFLIFLFPNTKGRNRVITREEENTKSKCDGGK